MLNKPGNQSPLPLQSGLYLTVYLNIGLPDVTKELRMRFKELLRWFIYDETLTFDAFDEGFVYIAAK